MSTSVANKQQELLENVKQEIGLQISTLFEKVKLTISDQQTELP